MTLHYLCNAGLFIIGHVDLSCLLIDAASLENACYLTI